MDESRIAERVAGSEMVARSVMGNAAGVSPVSSKIHMMVLANAVHYRLDPRPMKAVSWTSWTMSNRKDFLELYVSFDNKNRVSVSALAMDDSQEPIAEITDVRLQGDAKDYSKDIKKVLAITKKVIAEAKRDSLVDHLRLESTF